MFVGTDRIVGRQEHGGRGSVGLVWLCSRHGAGVSPVLTRFVPAVMLGSQRGEFHGRRFFDLRRVAGRDDRGADERI